MMLKRSFLVSLVTIFAALNVVCDSLPGLSLFEYGVWWSWIFLVVPITGIILGPYVGFLSTFSGVMIGHFIYFRGTPEFLFTMGAPLGAMISGLLFEGKWKTVFIFYTVFFIAYLATPVAWQLPIWGMWDTLLAFIGLFIVTIISTMRDGLFDGLDKKSPYSLAIYAFIGLEADVLFRIFLLVPCQMYQNVYGWSIGVLQAVWMLASAVTPFQVATSVLVTSIIGTPLIKIITKIGF